MSDYLPDTPSLGRKWCPACEPDADPTRSILDTEYCGPHMPARYGVEDAQAGEAHHLSGGSEADGYTCAAYAKLLREPR